MALQRDIFFAFSPGGTNVGFAPSWKSSDGQSDDGLLNGSIDDALLRMLAGSHDVTREEL